MSSTEYSEHMTEKINFITSNKGKITSLKAALKERGCSVEVRAFDLNLTEPQFDTVAEVSAFKAREAYSLLKTPVLVEDGGFEVEALKGFPGVYTKYILQTIGADGIIKLLSGEHNRRARFASCASYINEQGELFQFDREEGIKLEVAEQKVDINSPYAWSELWKILYVPQWGKVMCELTGDEVNELYNTVRGSLQKFAEWYTADRK